MKLGDDSSTDQQIQALEAFDFLYEDPDAGYDFGGLKRDSMKTNENEEGGQVESSRDESSDDEVRVTQSCDCIYNVKITVVIYCKLLCCKADIVVRKFSVNVVIYCNWLHFKV